MAFSIENCLVRKGIVKWNGSDWHLLKKENEDMWERETREENEVSKDLMNQTKPNMEKKSPKILYLLEMSLDDREIWQVFHKKRKRKRHLLINVEN